MLEIKYRTYDEMTNDQIVEMHVKRRIAFVDQLHWELPSGNSYLEVDQFDNEDSVYALGTLSGVTLASCRIRTKEKSMVAELWPSMLHFLQGDFTEVSRMCRHDDRFNSKMAGKFHGMIMEKYGSLFSVADDRTCRIYNRMGIPAEIVEFDGINLAIWR